MEHVQLDWNQYIEIAERFQGKARYEDREDLKHNIILALAEQRRRQPDALSLPAMLRIASHTVADYWRAEKRNGRVISLNAESDNGEVEGTELLDTLADDNALDLDAWVDARVWLLSCPNRLVRIAVKKTSGIALDGADRKCLCKWRRREQNKELFRGNVLTPQTALISGSIV